MVNDGGGRQETGGRKQAFTVIARDEAPRSSTEGNPRFKIQRFFNRRVRRGLRREHKEEKYKREQKLPCFLYVLFMQARTLAFYTT